MTSFRAYGLCFESEFPLEGFAETHDVPDVTIRFRPIDLDQVQQTERGGRFIYAYIGTELHFVIEDGRTITIERLGAVSDDELRGYILGLMMATLLRQRGHLVLHACGLVRGGEAIGFAGESGWGKSTLAEFFVQQGYTLVTDDVMAIDLESAAQPMIIPSYPEIRLREDSGTWLRPDFGSLPSVIRQSKKRLRRVDMMAQKPVPLRRLYMLQPNYRETTEVLPLPEQRIIVELLAHTRVTNLVNDPGYAAHHLQQCAELARKIPIRRLHRVRSFTALPDIQHAIEHDLARHPAT